MHSTDAFGTAGGKALADALVKLGTPSVLDQGYANQSQDFTPVVLAIKQSGADILGSYFTFENDLGIFARQLRQLGVNIPWVGSPSIVNVYGLSSQVRRCSAPTGSPITPKIPATASKAFGNAYRDAYKVAPDNQSFLALRCRHDPVGGDQQGRHDRSRQGPRSDAGDQETRAPKANTISTRTATVCTATTS